MKVTIPSGATYRRGSTEGSLSTGSKINDSGLTQSVATGIFTINGVSIYVDTNKDTIDDVIAKVNKSGANVTMAYDINTDKFTLTGKGAERITLGGEQDSSNFLQSIGLSYIFYQEETLGTPGSNAVFTVNGTKYERESNEVTDTIPGLSLSLVSEGITNINVKIDTDKAVNAMAEFASKYNTVINDLSPVKISDDFRSKYGKELSAEDKKGMSEDEAKAYQKNYESILKYDILSKSPELKQLKSTMRKNLMDEVSVSGSKYNSLTDLGIIIAGSKPADIQISSMGLLLDVSTDKEELAKYIKDNTSFASTVANNSEDVFNFFCENKEITKTDSAGRPVKDQYGNEVKVAVNQGWARKYDTVVTNNSNSGSPIYKKAGTNGSLDKKITSINKQIDTQTQRAEAYLERVWKQFSAMEQRVQNIQAQGSYLAQIGGKAA